VGLNSADVLGLDQLLELTLEPNWADLDPGNRRCLVVDLGDLPADSGEAEMLSTWFRNQPIPIVGVGQALASVDLVVAEDELDRAIACIDRNPQAAAVLVQVLRSTATLNVVDALTVESLAYATLQGGTEFANWLGGNRAAHPPRDSESDQAVLLDRLSDQLGDRLEVVLNSPATRNALSVAMRDGLTEAFKLVAVDDGIMAVSVSGNGPCFSAGGDLSEFGTVPDVTSAHAIRMVRMPARYLAMKADRYVFHLHGACIGAGIELPAFAGRVTATADAFFQLPEVGFGLIPGAGGCVSIPRRIGRQRTAHMAILGEPVTAEDALAWGLIDAILD
jgi:enoyl-CoA hydratase